MRDILSDLDHWQKDGEMIALATVIETWGSSPRRVSSKMAFTQSGKISGSVSGGCVENAVIEAGVLSLKTNQPRLLHFGVADETAWEVGLACGGSIDIFVKPLNSIFFEALSLTIKDEQPVVTVTVVRGPDEIMGRELLIHEDGRMLGTLGGQWDQVIVELAKEALSQGKSRRIPLNESVEVFADVILPPPTLIVVGGVHIAVTLVSLAKALDYRTIVIDPRQAWGNTERFPNIDQLIQAWPDQAFEQVRITRSTAIAVLTHDTKLDDPALQIALPSLAFYVGALGSKSTNAKRRARLLSNGISESQFARLHAPIGLDLGSESPGEIALAIMAEVITTHRKQNQPSAGMMVDLHPTA